MALLDKNWLSKAKLQISLPFIRKPIQAYIELIVLTRVFFSFCCAAKIVFIFYQSLHLFMASIYLWID